MEIRNIKSKKKIVDLLGICGSDFDVLTTLLRWRLLYYFR